MTRIGELEQSCNNFRIEWFAVRASVSGALTRAFALKGSFHGGAVQCSAAL